MTAGANPLTLPASRGAGALDPATLLNAFTLHALLLAEAIGIPRERLLAESGLDLAALADPDGRHPFAQHAAVIRLVAREGGPEAGLRLGALYRLEGLGALGYAAAHQPNLREAMRCITRFRRLIHELAMPDLVETDGLAILRYSVHPMFLAWRHPAESQVASTLQVVRQLVGADLAPRAVAFEHPAPPDVRPHARFFRCPVEFAAGRTELVFPGSVADLPLLRADAGVGGYLERHVEALLAKLPRDESWAARVREALAAELRGGEPTQARIARRLATSERTLQRRLAAEGARFADLLDALRRDLAREYLSEPIVSIGEVAFLLGYSEASAFHRAFRRWWGTTPHDWRRERRSATG